MASPSLDATNLRILALLQDNARISNADIARDVGIAPSAVYERIRRMEESRIIQGYTARIDPKALGLGTMAFISVRSDDRWGDLATATELAKIPGVQEVHGIAGEDCYLVKVRASDTDALVGILGDGFGSIDTMRSTKTTMVLRTVKETAALPLPAPDATARQPRPAPFQRVAAEVGVASALNGKPGVTSAGRRL